MSSREGDADAFQESWANARAVLFNSGLHSSNTGAPSIVPFLCFPCECGSFSCAIKKGFVCSVCQDAAAFRSWESWGHSGPFQLPQHTHDFIIGNLRPVLHG